MAGPAEQSRRWRSAGGGLRVLRCPVRHAFEPGARDPLRAPLGPPAASAPGLGSASRRLAGDQAEVGSGGAPSGAAVAAAAGGRCVGPGAVELLAGAVCWEFTWALRIGGGAAGGTGEKREENRGTLVGAVDTLLLVDI